MKKIFIVISFALITSSISAQSGGTGISSDPYWGDMSTAIVWSSGTYPGNTVYVGTIANPDLRIISNGHLTIDPGITVIFKQLLSDLIITGTGQITAGGAGSAVTFTKESNNYWGHISFESMGSAPASVFNNCIVEYGDVSSFALSDPHAGGGGMFIDFSNVSISNCTFRHNKSQWGGGIFVYTNRNPGIKNCYFYNNSAREAGGGIFLYYYATSVVENSIFYSNLAGGTSSSEYSGGGLAAFSSNAKVVNCTFVNNTSSRPNGQGLELYGASGSRVINSVLWGSANQLYLGAGTGENTIVNCAIQSAVPSGSVNSIVLNSSNSSPDGPNFNATDGSDWSIKFISPCRDAGTTPAPTVPNDFIGNPRIGPYDIGAYEVQYSRWSGASSDSWSEAANWEVNIDPSTGTGDVIVPSGVSTYPISAANPNFTINSGKYLILEPGARATLNSLTNNGGIIRMRANAAELSSLIMSSYTRGTGAGEDIQIYLTGGYTNPPNNSEGRWHYISSPVDGLSRTVFTSNTLDLARWVDGIQAPLNIRHGWVAYDGFAYLMDDPSADPSTWFGYQFRFNTLNLGQGYNFWDDLASNTYSISGQLNTQDRIVSLSFAGETYENGFNLLGNPFTSGLDWDYILANTAYPENTSHGIIFTKNNIQYYYNGGVQVPDDGSPAGVIPPMQGFFVKTINPAASINLTAAARTHTEIHPRYKGFAPVPLVRLELTENGLSDETVVRFAETAKSGFDYEFDALKMFIPSTAIYTTSPGMKYAINGQPYPDTSVEIPVSVIIPTDGTHSIIVKQLQGLENYSVELKDNITGFSANLKTTAEVTFSASKGTINDRFILKISNGATAIENPKTSDKTFNIYNGFGKVNIQTVSYSWDGKQGSVSIRDLTGRIIEESANVEFSRSSVIQLDAPAVKGMYIVEVRSGMKKYAGKVIIQ